MSAISTTVSLFAGMNRVFAVLLVMVIVCIFLGQELFCACRAAKGPKLADYQDNVFDRWETGEKSRSTDIKIESQHEEVIAHYAVK